MLRAILFLIEYTVRVTLFLTCGWIVVLLVILEESLGIRILGRKWK